MKNVTGFILTLGLVFGLVLAERPSWIKPCSRSAKDFQTCCVKNGNEAIPHLLKGDKRFGIPNCLPLEFPKVEVDAGPNLKVSLADVKFYGLDTTTLKDMDVDFSQHTAYLTLQSTRATLLAEYQINGQILVLPIQGEGPLNITIENSSFKYKFSYKLEVKGGKEFAIIQDDDKLEYDVGKAYIKLDHLFNGNEQMSDQVNAFLNENQQDVIKELGGAIEGTIKTIAHRVGAGILSNIAFDELFLE